MRTICWSVEKDVDKNINYPQIQEAAHLLQNNELIAFPTETVYGLGANASSDEAVKKIFKAKGRPADNPLIVHIANKNQLNEFVDNIPHKAKLLINEFWPGPLTLIFKKKKAALSTLVTAGLNTVAVRMPDHPIALALIDAAHLPIAAPSANKSGSPSPTTAGHVIDDLSGLIAGVIDGGDAGIGVESTVLDVTGEIPVILRPGGISKEQLEDIIGFVEVDPAIVDMEEKPKSPGMKYRHYAPSAPLYLVDGETSWLQQIVNEKRGQGLKVGILATVETANDYDADIVISCGSRTDLHSVAKSLYRTLRLLDKEQPDIIFSEVFSSEGVGAAIMNRLEKAAGHKWIKQQGD